MLFGTRASFDMSAAPAELTAAASKLRQAVADTFVSLADSWELGKKFSGEQHGASTSYDCHQAACGKPQSVMLRALDVQHCH